MAYRGRARPDTIINLDIPTTKKPANIKARPLNTAVLESTPTPTQRRILESIAEEILPSGLKQRNDSPWKSYDRGYELELSRHVTVIVAVQKEPRSELVNIRNFTKPEMETALYRYQTVRHSSFITALESFITYDHLYIVLEHMPISLVNIVEVSTYPTEVQLVAILAPVKLPRSLNPKNELIVLDSFWFKLS